mmetsp:Transcript_50080/g.154976  ORF Transcript_50080/g.154976 Transcript_50080/m.154976 type:complete len:284 (+) Transcript_50080:236-1087(+)
MCVEAGEADATDIATLVVEEVDLLLGDLHAAAPVPVNDARDAARLVGLQAAQDERHHDRVGAAPGVRHGAPAVQLGVQRRMHAPLAGVARGDDAQVAAAAERVPDALAELRECQLAAAVGGVPDAADDGVAAASGGISLEPRERAVHIEDAEAPVGTGDGCLVEVLCGPRRGGLVGEVHGRGLWSCGCGVRTGRLSPLPARGAWRGAGRGLLGLPMVGGVGAAEHAGWCGGAGPPHDGRQHKQGQHQRSREDCGDAGNPAGHGAALTERQLTGCCIGAEATRA